jgi:membrane-associated phospholipid phosphatase
LPLRIFEASGLCYFAYTLVVAGVHPTVPPHRRRRIAAISLAAGGFILAATRVAIDGPVAFALRNLVVPGASILLAYWTSGLFFVAPQSALERRLLDLDDRFGVRALAERLPPAVVALLEAAYFSIYPAIPIGFALLLLSGGGEEVDRYWTSVLVSDFVCFACLPWIQVRTPGSLEPPLTRRGLARRLNLLVAKFASIQVATVPSGHAAEALAVPLALARVNPLAAIPLVFLAVGVGAGAVVGRYHYMADALAGYAVAIGVWVVVTVMM